MMVPPFVSVGIPPMKKKFHKIGKIPSKAATDFAKRFGFYDHAGCDFRLPTEDDTAEGPARDGGLPFHTVDFSEGGVWIPLDILLCMFLKRVGLLPTQCSPTFFEIFNGFRSLGPKVLGGIWLDLDDSSHYYCLAKKGGSYTLESRILGRFLLTHIPESHHGTKPYVVYLTDYFEIGDKCPRVVGHPDCKRAFPYCPTPPHKELLDCLLDDIVVDRFVAFLLGYKQLNLRLRQIVSKGSASSTKAPVVINSTEGDSEESDSDNVSEYNPDSEMASVRDGSVVSGIEKSKLERQAKKDARRAKMRRMVEGSSRDKALGGSSVTVSPCVTSDDVVVMPPPRSASRGKAYKSPSYFAVERCARWEAPSGASDERRAELEKLPRLPRHLKTQGFGVIGVDPEYAYDVLAPYMSFEGDESKLESETSTQSFSAMLEDSASLMPKLSFNSRTIVRSGSGEKRLRLVRCGWLPKSLRSSTVA